jgi:NDP-sugar pyrophosphorylase family protein
MIETAVILAGGKGERMMPLTRLQPKALAPIHGIPVLKLQIDQLIRNNVSKIIVLTGHLGEQVHQYVASLNLGTRVTCIQSDPELNPAERLIQAYKLFSGSYILLYCDNYIPTDSIINQQLNTKSGISLVLQKRQEGNIFINESLSAVYVSKERNSSHPYVELGYIAVNDKHFDHLIATYKDINLALEDYSKKYQVKFTNLNNDVRIFLPNFVTGSSFLKNGINLYVRTGNGKTARVYGSNSSAINRIYDVGGCNSSPKTFIAIPANQNAHFIYADNYWWLFD